MNITPQPSTALVRLTGICVGLTLLSATVFAAPPPQVAPDLTKGETAGVDRKGTYNLGATGMRGWIYLKPATHFDGLQGRTTGPSRQILVTHVGAKSPADGVMKVDDVILGAGGKLFTDDARKSIAAAIQQAETESSKGILKLTCWRAGKIAEVQLKLNVMGTYSATAPYDCPKSKRIFEGACKALEQERLEENWRGSISGLALLASGKPEYLPKLQAFARKMGPPTMKLERGKMSAWEGGYRNVFLCEYFLLTGDQQVLPAITEITTYMARGQSMYGTCGHGFSELTADGKLHGSIPPYGPVNAGGLVANLGIIMGAKCGVKDPEIAPAIERASKFFGYFVDKGAIPYGEHEPWPYHENNGKNAQAALLFATQKNRTVETQFFAKMVTASFKNRESGHTGQGFSYLWGALGAATGGPTAMAAYFKEASWHFDLARRCDGSFTYDGGEQYGPGKTDDNTYYGKSGYYGLSPNATYVLTYSLPLRKLYITGKAADKSNWLSTADATAAIASGNFDLERLKMTPKQLVAAFGDWSPIVRGWAGEELAKRPEAQAMVPELMVMAEGKDAHVRQGACEALGFIKNADALPVLVRLLSHPDRSLRFRAAQAIRKMGGAAQPAIPGILTAVVKTAEPIQPIDWADPIQLTHGQLAAALFGGPLATSVQKADTTLLYPAVRVFSRNADGMARAKLRSYFQNQLSLEDVQALGPDIFVAIKTPSPADKMFSNEIRMGGFKALSKYHFKEGIEAGIIFVKTQGGHGSERRTGEIMQELVKYGTAARSVLPELKGLLVQFDTEVKNKQFPPEPNKMRVASVEEAIRSIESATTQPELRSISKR